jgi:hypothetical protein
MSAENPHAGQGPVLLDVGGQVGALLVRMPESLVGVEIEIRPHLPALDAGPAPHSHVEVMFRPTPGGSVSCAVFPELAEGEYELYERPSGPVRLRVRITGGQVAQASWPQQDPLDPPPLPQAP